MTTVAVKENTSIVVPELVRPPMEIDGDDVRLPKVKVAHYSSDAVKEGLVKAGSIFTTTGADDQDPVTLLAPQGRHKDTMDADKGVLIHVLGLKKGLSYSAPGESLETWRFGDASAPAEAWTTYTFYVCLAEDDPSFPFTFLFTKSGKAVAQQILTTWARSGKPVEELAFRIKTKFRENDKGQWFVPVASVVEATDENVAAARLLMPLLANQPQNENVPTEQPAI